MKNGKFTLSVGEFLNFKIKFENEYSNQLFLCYDPEIRQITELI